MPLNIPLLEATLALPQVFLLEKSALASPIKEAASHQRIQAQFLSASFASIGVVTELD